MEKSFALIFEAGMIASQASEYSRDERKREVLLQLSGLAMEAIQNDLPNDVSNFILGKCGELQDEWFDKEE